MRIEKAKLPKGMSYVLKSSLLEAALAAAGITLDVHLIHSPGAIFFDTFFWPPNANVDHERLYIRAGAVPAADGDRARRHMQTVVLPELVAWVQSVLALPVNAPRRRQSQYFSRHLP